MRGKSFKNALWMVSEKIVSIFGLLFVTSFVAKYIGPYRFGQIALAIAIFQVVQVIAQMGFDNVLFKRISVNKTSGLKLISATFTIRTYIYLFMSVFVLLYFYFKGDALSFIFMTSVCVAFYFTSIDVYMIYNDATLASKRNTYANIAGLIISLIMRYFIAELKLPIWLLSIPIVLTSLIPFFIRYSMAPKLMVKDRNNKKRYNRYILITGVPLVISTVSMAIYSRVNQFTVSYFIGNYELGVYSVALTLGTAWGFVGNALAISFLSKIYSEKNVDLARDKTAGLILGVFFILMFFPLGFIFLGKFVILYLYGSQYIEAYRLGIIVCFSTIISTIGFVSNRYIVKYSGYSYLSKKTLITLILSIPLSALMVSNFGVIGAAYSIILIEVVSLTIMNYCYKNFLVLKMHLSVFNVKNIKHLFE